MAIVMVMTLLPTSALAVDGDTGLQAGQVHATKALVLNDENQPEVDEGGYYTVQITVQGKPKQAENGSKADVVLVVDNSGSMSSSVGEKCNSTDFKKESSSNFLLGWTWESYRCQKCKAEYFLIRGNATGNVYYTDLPTTCTGEVGKTPRIDAAKDVSKEFAKNILAERTGNQLAVIGFAHEKDKGGANDTGAIKVAQPLTKNLSDVNTAIGQMKANGGTNYTAALVKAQEYLNGRSESDKATRPGYVIFISDGAPGLSGDSLKDSKWNGSEQIKQLKTAGITVYTVGIALGTDAANYLKSMASDNQDEHFINVSTVNYKDEMSKILQTWATKINSIPAGRDATITDVVNTGEFEYKMENTPKVTNDTATGTIIWDIGKITEEPQSIEFKVKPRDGKYGTLYTNKSVELSYTDCNNEAQKIKDTKATTEPKIGDPSIEIANPARAYTVEYYYDDVQSTAPTGAPTGSTANVGAIVTINVGDNADATHFPKQTTVGTENYAFDEGAENVLSVTIGAEQENILKVYYASDKNKDGIPDKYQAFVKFESADATKGTVAGTGAVQVFTFKNAEGEYLTSGNVTPSLANVTTTPADGFAFDIWTKDKDVDSVNPEATMESVPGGTTITFKANWKSNVVTITFDANGGAWAADVAGYKMNDDKTTASREFKPSDTVEKITPNPANETKKFVGWGISADATEPLSLLALSPQAAKLKELTKGTGTLYAIWEDAAQPTEKLNYTIHQHYIGSNGKQDAQFNDELPKTASAGTKISDLIPAELQTNRKYYYQTYIYLSSETKIVNDNVATPVADDTVLNKDNTQIHLYYYLDAWNDKNNTLTGGDNIPDKYQAVVTYKVVGGTWKDKTTDDQVQVFTLKTKNEETGVWEDVTPAPVLGDTIPTGMISSYSRTASQSWDKDITKDTKVTESVTYTYTFTKGSSGGGGGSSSTHYYISLKKVDAQDGEALSGAKFGLYLDGKQIATATSDRNGIVRFSMGSSNYRSLTDKSNLYCQELTAPEGYKLSNEKIAVSKKDVSTSSSMSDKNAKTVKNSRSKTPSMLNGKDHFAYIVGYPDKTVHPQSSITRAEVATIFFRLLTEETRTANATKTNNYADVSSDKWYNQAVSTLSAMGIIKGDSRGNFNPNAPITRAEFAAIAARFDKTEDVAAASFGDVATHWAKPEISVAANNGWINGYTDGTFHPDSRITRAEAMAMINRVLQRLPESKADLLDGMIQWSDNADTSKWYYLAVQEATNSHYYELKANQHEKWTKLRENRDWTELEK